MTTKKVLNKSGFVEYLKTTSGYKTKTEAENAIDSVISAITKALSEKNKISFIGFGTFEVKERKARDGRNPKTGKVIKIPAYRQATFKAGVGLKDSVNGKKKPAAKKK